MGWQVSPIYWSHGEILIQNSAKYVSPDGFFCIQILLNSISAAYNTPPADGPFFCEQEVATQQWVGIQE